MSIYTLPAMVRGAAQRCGDFLPPKAYLRTDGEKLAQRYAKGRERQWPLARRAVQGTDFECISPSLVGPLVLAFSEEDPGAAARVFKEFLKEKDNDKLIVKALAFGGQLLGPQDLDALASMPTRDQAISLLMAVMKAPLDKFARTLNEIPGKLVRTVEAIRVQKAESEAA